MAPSAPNEHDVMLDSAGWGSHARLTCRTCDGATYVTQPYMTQDEATAGMEAFLAAHPGYVLAAG